MLMDWKTQQGKDVRSPQMAMWFSTIPVEIPESFIL